MTDETFADKFLAVATPPMLEMEQRFRDLMAGLRPTVNRASTTTWEDLALEDEAGLLERLSGNGN